jgi:tubulin monoglycylase TTLL3/8
MEGDRGVWILKPAGKSRGRGIGCVTSLDHARKHILAGSHGPFELRRRAWVAQKYIERPLLIRGRKFDIRVWVFVTSVAPLRVWVWQEPYLRFCAEEYTLDDVSNVFRHLSNHAIAARSASHVAHAVGEGNAWRLENFKAFLRDSKERRAKRNHEADRMGHGGDQNSGRGRCIEDDVVRAGANGGDEDPDEWTTGIQPQIDAAVSATLRCAEDGLEVDAKTRACALYGYDFVIDEHMHVWLLEVNSSPCMEHTTPVTADLCPRAFADLFGIVEDDAEKNDVVGTERGGWKLAHAGDRTSDRSSASSTMAKWGIDMTVHGSGGARAADRGARAEGSDAPRGCTATRTAPLTGTESGGLPRAPAWKPAWERLSKPHARSTQETRVVRVK